MKPKDNRKKVDKEKYNEISSWMQKIFPHIPKEELEKDINKEVKVAKR